MHLLAAQTCPYGLMNADFSWFPLFGNPLFNSEYQPKSAFISGPKKASTNPSNYKIDCYHCKKS
jgi:hypothetical protein